jgi:hypothetical protein
VVRQHLDNSVAAWGNDHRSSDSTNALQALTNLGNIRIVVGLALLLVVVDLYRCRSRWPFLFLLTVLAGTEVSMLVVKDRTASAHAQPGCRVARPIVSERALRDRSRLLRRGKRW